MNGREERDSTDRRDEALATTLREGLDPGARPPARRSAFARAVDERIASKAPRLARPLWAAVAGAAAVAVVWLGLPGGGGEVATGEVESLLVYAYYETDYLSEGADDDAFMTDEYLAIASAFDLP